MWRYSEPSQVDTSAEQVAYPTTAPSNSATRHRNRGSGLPNSRDRNRSSSPGAGKNAVAEAREATGYTADVIQRTVDSVGAALRLDHRADFYTELGSLSDSGGFEAFLNHWWTQGLADSIPDEDTREQAIDFADVAVSLYARTTGGATSTSAQIDAIIAGAEAS
ncbi:hypothetical protein [Streptomyces sp. WM6386]|uniref:hypothetical protein n=1 Tax=Streptomyces sp. WM6386 TaxID=1415558 RepID=UPI000698234C|nr:hypothetical protein [Streptomyces sp. WM6386]